MNIFSEKVLQMAQQELQPVHSIIDHQGNLWQSHKISTHIRQNDYCNKTEAGDWEKLDSLYNVHG